VLVALLQHRPEAVRRRHGCFGSCSSSAVSVPSFRFASPSLLLSHAAVAGLGQSGRALSRLFCSCAVRVTAGGRRQRALLRAFAEEQSQPLRNSAPPTGPPRARRASASASESAQLPVAIGGAAIARTFPTRPASGPPTGLAALHRLRLLPLPFLQSAHPAVPACF
jgi:hypothetical protein